MQKRRYSRLAHSILLLGLLHCSVNVGYAELKVEITYKSLDELDEATRQLLLASDPVRIFREQPQMALPVLQIAKYSVELNQIVKNKQHDPVAVQFSLQPSEISQFSKALQDAGVTFQSEVENMIFANLSVKQLNDKKIYAHPGLLMADVQQQLQQPDDNQDLANTEQTLQLQAEQETSSSVQPASAKMRIVSSPYMALSILDELSEKEQKRNIVVSPQSLAETGMALLMASQNPKDLKRPKWFLTEVETDEHHKIDQPESAIPSFQSWNNLWYAQRYTVHPGFEQDYQGFLHGTVQKIDLSQVDQSVQKINGYISEKTSHKISNLISRSEIAGADAVLSNVAYFKADWLSPFAKYKTTLRPFHNADQSVVKVDTMTEQKNLTYASHRGWTLVELPFKDQQTILTLLLPPENKTLSLPDAKRLQQLDARKSERKAVVFLPKIKLQGNTVEMKQLLPNFSSWNLDRLVNETGIGQLKGLHQATIEWDEVGAEATAATIVTGSKSLGSHADVQVVFDRPFVFLIRQGNNILFTGAVRQLDEQTAK